MNKSLLKPVRWIGSSYDNWIRFPDDVQDVIGYSLYLAQAGRKAANTCPMKGYRGAKVLEIRDDFNGNTFRAVYTLEFRNVIYVLHAFQKKSKHGISTPRGDIELVQKRLMQAKKHYEENPA